MRGAKGCAAGTTEDFTPEEHVWHYVHPRTRRSNTKLTLFDYVEGSYKQWLNWDGRQPPGRSPNAQVSIRDGATKCGSIISLYNYIKSIGVKAPRSISELQFFTHGWHEGPIIIDSDEDETYANDHTRRDPNDGDTRLKDFDIADVLGGKSGEKFSKAFARNALIKLWGCDYVQEHRDKVRSFYEVKTTREKKRKLDSYLTYIWDSTYAFKLAKLLGVPVYAAPLGWGTNPSLPFGIEGKVALETKAKYRGIWPPRKGDQWWRVSPFFRPNRGFEFYNRILRAQMDLLDYVAYMEWKVSTL